MSAMHLFYSRATQPNLDLKTQPIQVLGSIQLDIILDPETKHKLDIDMAKAESNFLFYKSFAMNLLCTIAIQPNLELKTQPKQLLGSLLLDIVVNTEIQHKL